MELIKRIKNLFINDIFNLQHRIWITKSYTKHYFKMKTQLFSFGWSSTKDIPNVSNTVSIETLFNDLQTKKVFREMIIKI